MPVRCVCPGIVGGAEFPVLEFELEAVGNVRVRPVIRGRRAAAVHSRTPGSM